MRIDYVNHLLLYGTTEKNYIKAIFAGASQPCDMNQDAFDDASYGSLRAVLNKG